jgi:hypothetical protein
MDIIFRQRDLDYFSMLGDKAVEKQAIKLLHEGRHDIIIAYQMDYDEALHAYGVYSPQAMQAAEEHIVSFERLYPIFREQWAEHRKLILFAPDHGAHDVNGKGTHGDDIPDDMLLKHFWGWY